MRPLYTIRDYIAGDLPLILNSWINSYCTISIDSNIANYDKHKYHSKIQSLIAKPGTKILIAGDGLDIILGWLCYDDSAYHYGYVKGPYRRMGIMRSLLGAVRTMPSSYTHYVPAIEYLIKDCAEDDPKPLVSLKKPTYNPKLFWE